MAGGGGARNPPWKGESPRGDQYPQNSMKNHNIRTVTPYGDFGVYFDGELHGGGSMVVDGGGPFSRDRV